jgi:hypothetical protein
VRQSKKKEKSAREQQLEPVSKKWIAQKDLEAAALQQTAAITAIRASHARAEFEAA